MKKNRNTKKKVIITVSLLVIVVIIYILASPKIVISPVTEKNRIEKLEKVKEKMKLSEFETDGCSGNISNIWNTSVQNISEISEDFRDKYKDSKVPFEYACIEHDKKYHAGEGGYVGRLIADNNLRNDIISYAIKNADEIVKNSKINTKEEVIFMFDLMAEAIYRGVRIGGAACSNEPYAWGYGYGSGDCNID